jgi:hypothetical protein
MRFLQSMGCITPAAIVIYGIVGLLFLGQFGDPALNYVRSLGWEQASGTVISSQVADEWDTTGDRYIGRVVYTYEVNGETYEGNQINLSGPAYVGNREDAERVLIPYPVGASVTPYVDPNDPTRAVLDRNLTGATWGIVGVGSALLLLSVGLGVYHLANRKRGQK